MFFLSKNLNAAKIKKLESEAFDVLELPNELKAFRINDEVVVVDKKRIANKFEDTFSANPARATYQLMKKMNISIDDVEKKSKKENRRFCNCASNSYSYSWNNLSSNSSKKNKYSSSKH